ncbi:MAG: hypothetical protein JSV77_01335 [Dehalococcoidales bacterium]|nr:MAG: hypothetical protein JSV77_01335 [Dehalococcoidales bacterium]
MERMEREVADSLRRFFSAQTGLSELGVIKSRDYIGDIGRYVCMLVYGLKVPKGRKPTGYDGKIDKSRVAVRLNNCPVGTPVRLPEPLDFDELIVVLGPNCLLRPEGVASDFIFYRFTPEQVRKRFKKTRGGYVGGGDVFDRTYDKVLNITAG